MKRHRSLFASGLLIALQAALSASAAETGVVRRMTAVKVVPSQPKPDQPFRLHVDGTGRCKLWVRTKLLDPSPYGGPTIPSSSFSFAGVWDLTAPPTATVNLPGDLPSMSLSTGHWAIGVSAREMLNPQNCKGEEIVEVRVGNPPTVPIPIAPGGGGKVTGAAVGGGSSSTAAIAGGGTSSTAGVSGSGGSAPNTSSASQLTRRLTSVTVIPSQPKADQPFRMRADGTGNCKLWVRTKLLDPSPSGESFGTGGGISFAGVWDLTAPPTATLSLPGDLPSMSLSTGHWAIGVSAREGYGGNCKGEEIVEVRVGTPPTVPIPIASGAGGKAAGAAAVSGGSTAGLTAGGASSSAAGMSGAGGSNPNASAATQLTHRMTSVKLVPAQPKPDQPFRLHVEGTGSCRLWVRTKLLDPAPAGGPSFGTGGGISFAGVWDLTAPPTATLNLPGDLPPMSLSTGHWAIGVSAREGYGGNCKGEEIVDVRIGGSGVNVSGQPAGSTNLPLMIATPTKK